MLFIALQNPLLILALLVAGWAAWRIARWAGSGGGLPLRGRRGSASAFAGSSLAVQALYQPGVRHVVEAQVEAQEAREDDEDGDPPDPGGR